MSDHIADTGKMVQVPRETLEGWGSTLNNPSIRAEIACDMVASAIYRTLKDNLSTSAPNVDTLRGHDWEEPFRPTRAGTYFYLECGTLLDSASYRFAGRFRIGQEVIIDSTPYTVVGDNVDDKGNEGVTVRQSGKLRKKPDTSLERKHDVSKKLSDIDMTSGRVDDVDTFITRREAAQMVEDKLSTFLAVDVMELVGSTMLDHEGKEYYKHKRAKDIIDLAYRITHIEDRLGLNSEFADTHNKGRAFATNAEVTGLIELAIFDHETDTHGMHGDTSPTFPEDSVNDPDCVEALDLDVTLANEGMADYARMLKDEDAGVNYIVVQTCDNCARKDHCLKPLNNPVPCDSWRLEKQPRSTTTTATTDL
jgi:hypothetical protein